MSRGLAPAVILGAAVVLSPLPAAADEPAVIRDAEHYYQLAPDGDWRQVKPAAGPDQIMVALRHRDGRHHATVTRVPFPNPNRTKSAFHDQVERGLQASVPGYKRLSRKMGRYRHVRIMDLWFRRGEDRDDRELVRMRLLFFRGFTLIATASGPASMPRAMRRQLDALAKSFVPYFAP